MTDAYWVKKCIKTIQMFIKSLFSETDVFWFVSGRMKGLVTVVVLLQVTAGVEVVEDLEYVEKFYQYGYQVEDSYTGRLGSTAA